MITRDLIDAILQQYALDRDSLHGISHWARVLENGLRLAGSTGAAVPVVQLFAVLHDACRLNEHLDYGHGRRGAEFAKSLRGVLFNLPEADFELLYTACARHTDGGRDGDVTVQTCWDADRLDLARAGIQPEPRYLCTPAAMDSAVIAWATKRSLALVTPSFVHTDWLPGHR